MPFDPKELIHYPKEPGVYLMKDSNGRILYVGKAKCLRTRIQNYFQKKGDERQMLPHLLSQINSIETIVTLSEKDALILEAQLIKKHLPKYNVLLKDDKSFISLIITKHKWPMIKLMRFKKRPSSKEGILFGPYTNAKVARSLLDLLCQLFPLRQCSDAELSNRVRPCLLFEIGKCLAPCTNQCTQETYQSTLDEAVSFLKGHKKALLQKLESKREAASKNLEFEAAKEYHLMIDQVEKMQSPLSISGKALDAEVVGLAQKGTLTSIVVLSIEEGAVVRSEAFHFHFLLDTKENILESFLLQHYRLDSSRRSFQELLLPFRLPNETALKELIQETLKTSFQILTPKQKQKRALVEMAEKNAKALLEKEESSSSIREKMLLDLSETLELTRFPKRIECLDTSNIAGTHPVASIVCFIDGQKAPSKNRLFHIKGAGDDYNAMKEVLERHLKKQKENQDFPDLLIVDGGKGQLHLAETILQELKIANIDLIALAKEGARHDKGLTAEQIFLPSRKEALQIPLKSPLLFLLQKIRDEAHRSAIGFHRKTRSTKLLKSALDALSGIGPVKKKILLQHFQSVDKIRMASKEELEKVPKLTSKDIDTLLQWQNLTK